MAFTPRFWRSFKYGSLLFLAFSLISIIRFTVHQSQFQQHLKSQYITWSDFPSSYTSLLKSKDWSALNEFDYQNNFPHLSQLSNDNDNTTTIPPIIHFIWFQNIYSDTPNLTSIPSLGSHAPEICQSYNPSWTIHLWNASSARDLLSQHFPWFLPTYDNYRYPIQRVDAFKYFVLYHYGGVYMDLDIACRRSLEPLLPFPAWFPEASPLGVNNDLMAARARHPVVKSMIDSLKKRDRNLVFPYLTIFWSTGPQFTGDLLKRWFLRHGSGYVEGMRKSDADPDEWFVLPQVFYSEEYTFFGHSPGGTWHEEDVAVVLWFVAHPVVFWFLVGSLFGGIVFLAVRLRKMKSRPAGSIKAEV